MSHLTELQFSMLADNALSGDELSIAQAHLSGCDECRRNFGIYEDDARMVRMAFDLLEDQVIPDPPKFKKPLGFREFAFVNLLTGSLFWLAQFSWKTLFGDAVMDGFSWLSSMVVPDAYDVATSTILYVTLEGTAMFETYSEFIVLCIAAMAISWLVLSYKKSITMSVVALLTATATMLPQHAEAFQHHKGDLVVGSDQTINDTIVFTGESLSVDGNINGDLVAFGKRIVINGKIDGNLVVAAESISISGEVTGTVVNTGETIDLAGLIVGGDVWGAGQSVRVNQDSHILGNAILAGELTSVAGEVGRDLVTAAESSEVSGKIGEDVVAYVERIQLLGDALVTGDVTVHSRDEDSLVQSSSATVGGAITYEQKDMQGKPRNRYMTFEYYIRQLIRLVAAFIVGYGLFTLIPNLQRVSLDGGAAGVITGATGLIGMAAAPVVALILAITVVGLPLAFLSIFGWLTVLYLAKILVAWMIGSMLIDESEQDRSVVATLGTGLIIVIVAVSLPFVGGFVNLVLTAVGFGMMIQWLRAAMR